MVCTHLEDFVSDSFDSDRLYLEMHGAMVQVVNSRSRSDLRSFVAEILLALACLGRLQDFAV